MEIVSPNSSLNAAINKNAPATEPPKPNAFGIGAANRVEPELSPQARSLQALDQQQRARTEQLRAAQDKPEPPPEPANETIRVSTTLGKANRSQGLTADEAIELYRSIEQLL